MAPSSDGLDALLEEIWNDADRGNLRPVEDYLRRCPPERHEELRAEYLAAQGEFVVRGDGLPSPGTDADTEIEPTLPKPADAGGGDRRPGPQGTVLPKMIGRYRVLGELPGGGMGRLFLGEDPTIRRKVVLKTTKFSAETELSGKEALGRLRREARAGGRLSHPNVCPVLDVVEEGGSLYVVMPFIEGETLHEVIERAKGRKPGPQAGDTWWLSLGRESDGGGESRERDLAESRPIRSSLAPGELPILIRTVETIAGAMHEVHELGIVHRDLKPGNIMIQPDGDPVILDFGLAVNFDIAAADRDTLDGMLIGTIPYMAPEQAEGRVRDIDRRTDIYALGVILFEMLTLRRPFERSNKEALLNRIARGDPPRVRSYNPRVNADLEAVCLRCLERDPAKRYSTAADLANDLEAVRFLRPVTARRVTAVGRAWRFCRRNKVAAAAIGVGAVLLSIVLVLWFTWVPGSKVESMVAVARFFAAGDPDDSLRDGARTAVGDAQVFKKMVALATVDKVKALELAAKHILRSGVSEALGPTGLTFDPEPEFRFRGAAEPHVDYRIVVRDELGEKVHSWEVKDSARDGSGVIITRLPGRLPMPDGRPRRYSWTVESFSHGTRLNLEEPVVFALAPEAHRTALRGLLNGQPRTPSEHLVQAKAHLLLGQYQDALLAIEQSGVIADPVLAARVEGLRYLCTALASGERWALDYLAGIATSRGE